MAEPVPVGEVLEELLRRLARAGAPEDVEPEPAEAR
jgi:hypothetical protein